MPDDPAAPSELEIERDLYLRLLSLGERSKLGPLLEDALGLIVELVAADSGYIELLEPQTGEPAWSLSRVHPSLDPERFEAAISRGIIADALAHDETTNIESALSDERYASRESVRIGKIEAVLCVPIGRDPAIGVLYLQGRSEPGAFPDRAVHHAEVFGRHFAPFADRLISKDLTLAAQDATAELRASLKLEGVRGRSPALANVLRLAAQVAPLGVNVLLTGESGTGKSQLAKVIHANGPRAHQPFVEINCAAIPESLFENELFGHVSGAYSGAEGGARGKVAAAEYGTLFLDEIAEIPLQLQGKLLQLLQSRCYYPVGSAEAVNADIRVIAATNQDLEECVQQKRFREDLFYRLQVLPIRLPSLAERRDDLPELAEHFAHAARERHEFQEIRLSRSAIYSLEATEWPGNLRQLGHCVEAGVIRAISQGAPIVESRHLFPGDTDPCDGQRTLSLSEATRRFQGEFLKQSLEDTGWNIAETARKLDIARSHAYTLIKAHELKRGSR